MTPAANTDVKRTRTKMSKGTSERTLGQRRGERLIPELENEIPFSPRYVSEAGPRGGDPAINVTLINERQ